MFTSGQKVWIVRIYGRSARIDEATVVSEAPIGVIVRIPVGNLVMPPCAVCLSWQDAKHRLEFAAIEVAKVTAELEDRSDRFHAAMMDAASNAEDLRKKVEQMEPPAMPA